MPSRRFRCLLADSDALLVDSGALLAYSDSDAYSLILTPTRGFRRPTGRFKCPTGVFRRPAGVFRRPTGGFRRPTGRLRSSSGRFQHVYWITIVTLHSFISTLVISYASLLKNSTLF